MPSSGKWKILEKEYRLIDAKEVPLQHPVRVFYDYFMSKRGPDGYLDRASFDPLEYPRLLPWVQILEEVEPEVFRHRVVGTAIVRLLGRDSTGKLFGEGITAKSKQTRTEEMRMAFTAAEPVRMSCPPPVVGLSVSLISCPAGASGGHFNDRSFEEDFSEFPLPRPARDCGRAGILS